MGILRVRRVAIGSAARPSCRHSSKRCLALNRFISAHASTLTFERPKDFDLKQFDDDGRFRYGDGKKIQLSFQITKEAGLHVVKFPLYFHRAVLELVDTYEITATVVDTDMLDW